MRLRRLGSILSIVTVTILTGVVPFFAHPQAQAQTASAQRCQYVFTTNLGHPVLNHTEWLQTATTTEQRQQVIRSLIQETWGDYRVADEFADILKQNLSSEGHVTWLKSMADMYRSTTKFTSDAQMRRRIPERRLMDRMMTVLQNPSEFLKANIEKGAKPVEVYSEFIRRQQNLFNKEIPYSGQTVMAVARDLQTTLKHYEVFYNKDGKRPGRIVLGGTFVNGKAKSETSDLDITFSNDVLRNFAGQKYQKGLMIEGFGHLPFEPHTFGGEFYGKMNPVVLVITADQITMRVYSTPKDPMLPAQSSVPYKLE